MPWFLMDCGFWLLLGLFFVVWAVVVIVICAFCGFARRKDPSPLDAKQRQMLLMGESLRDGREIALH
jgi:hypothetical protein